MSGTIAVTKTDLFLLNSWMYDWFIMALADEADDPELTRVLTENLESQIMWLGINTRDDGKAPAFIDLTPELAEGLIETARRALIPRAKRDFAGRPRFLADVLELLEDFLGRLARAQ